MFGYKRSNWDMDTHWPSHSSINQMSRFAIDRNWTHTQGSGVSITTVWLLFTLAYNWICVCVCVCVWRCSFQWEYNVRSSQTIYLNIHIHTSSLFAIDGLVTCLNGQMKCCRICTKLKTRLKLKKKYWRLNYRPDESFTKWMKVSFIHKYRLSV